MRAKIFEPESRAQRASWSCHCIGEQWSPSDDLDPQFNAVPDHQNAEETGEPSTSFVENGVIRKLQARTFVDYGFAIVFSSQTCQHTAVHPLFPIWKYPCPLYCQVRESQSRLRQLRGKHLIQCTNWKASPCTFLSQQCFIFSLFTINWPREPLLSSRFVRQSNLKDFAQFPDVAPSKL